MRIQNLLLVNTFYPDCPQDLSDTFLLHCLQLRLAFHKEHPRKSECIDAQLVARLAQHMVFELSRDEMHVFECEDHVVRRRTRRVCRIVTNRRDRQVKKGDKRLAQDVLENLPLGGRGECRKATNVVCIGECG